MAFSAKAGCFVVDFLRPIGRTGRHELGGGAMHCVDLRTRDAVGGFPALKSVLNVSSLAGAREFSVVRSRQQNGCAVPVRITKSRESDCESEPG